MGLLDKLKQAKNFVTGGGAKIHIEQLSAYAPEAGSLQLKISCEIDDAEISINNVYLKVRAEERVVVEDYDFEIDGHSRRERIFRDTVTFEDTIVIADAQTLAANSSHQWEVDLKIPEDAHGTYSGIHARHVWEVQAALDKSGNDPDSGWIEIEIYK